MKFKNQLFIALVCSVLFLSGCESLKNNSKNLTRPKIAQNYSDKYRLSFKFDGRDACVVKDSIKGWLVIDGKFCHLQNAKNDNLIFYYDYELPENRTKARYYYEFTFDYKKGKDLKRKSFKSKIYNLNVLNRYSIDLECDRGVVGSEVVIVGRGFEMDDDVLFGNEVCDSQYESQNSIKFTVPNVAVGKKYPVKIVSDHDTIRVGEFFVDGGKLSSNVDSLDLSVHESSILVYMSETEALAEGINLNMFTDIPESIKFKNNPCIQPGSKTVSLVVQATDKAASGNIIANAEGFNEVVIPVVVTGKTLEIDAPKQKSDEFSPEMNKDKIVFPRSNNEKQPDSIFVE